MATYPAKVIRPIVGNIYEAIDGSLYGYSGEVSFDVSASASYNLMRFSLTRDARFRAYFNCDWAQARSSNADIGVLFNVDDIDVINQTVDTNGMNNFGAWTTDFYVPENAEVVISLLNPSASAGLVKGNITLNGKYLEKAEGNASAGVQVGDNALPPMIANRERYMNWNKELF